MKRRGSKVHCRAPVDDIGWSPLLSRQLTQQEIDAVFQNLHDRKREAPAVRFDFRRPDRIPKSQVRAIHLLHDTFVRNLVSSLSAYLRSYLTVNLVSVEQLSYAEFLDGLPSPTCMVSLGLSPYDGNGVLELNPSLVFPILEMLLGGSGKSSSSIQRDITEIEQKLLDGLFRIILHDLREAWKAGHQRRFHDRIHGDRAAVAAHSGAQRSGGLDRHRGPHRRDRRHDEHRHAVDRHQDDAAEVRPAVVGAQDACQRWPSRPACCACCARRLLAVEARLEGPTLTRAGPAEPHAKATC